MNWQEKPPAPELVRLLNEYQGYGGVVEFALFDDDACSLSEPELHRKAAVATLRVFGERNEQYFADEGVIQAFKDAGLNLDNYFRVVTQPEKADGREIGVTEFIGPLYDAGSHRLLLRGRTRDYLNNFFLWSDVEGPDTVCKSPQDVAQGYTYAFTEPPYRLQGTNEEINALFLALNTLLFNDFESDLIIYEWSTDWSTFFDAGHEWWGAFLWTVHNTKTNLVIGIGASTTD